MENENIEKEITQTQSNKAPENFPTKKQKSWLMIILIALLIISFGTVGVFAYKKYRPVQNLQKIDISKIEINISPTPTSSKNSSVDKTGYILFKKVEGEDVKEVRSGPDGNTIHLKISKQEREKDILEGCGMYGAKNGYLRNSDNFVFIEIENSNQAFIVIEKLENKEIIKIPLTQELITGFVEKIEDKNSRVINQKTVSFYKNKYELEDILGTNNKKYFYPECDTKVNEEKLIVYFGQLALALDIKNKKILGNLALIEPEYDYQELAFFFQIHSSEKLPYINIIEGLWEGDRKFQALLDLSGDNLKIINLTKYNEKLWNVYQSKQVIWSESNVIINFFKEEDILNEVIEEKFGKTKEYLCSIDNDKKRIIENKNEIDNIETQLKNSGNYKEVVCLFNNAIYCGCKAITSFNAYQYTPGGELIKSE